MPKVQPGHDDKFDEDFVKCSPDLALAVYDKDADAALSKGVHDFTKDTYLAGTRWIIKANDVSTLGKIKDKLGGSLVAP